MSHDLIDRAVTYGGSGAIALSGQVLQAQETMTLTQVPIPGIEITIGDICTIIGAVGVVGKLTFDYLNYRRRK